MAAETRPDFSSLIEDLKDNAPSYSVFHAVSVAEILSKAFHPERDEEKFDQTGLRFRPYEQYAFPPRDIHSFDWEEGRATFVLTFMGLYGIDSPLPRLYHEQVALQQTVHGPGNVPLQNFLDMFNTRFYWLYYQAWKKYRFHLQAKMGARSKVFERIFTFSGLPHRLKSDDHGVPEFQWLRVSSILSHRVRSKAGLRLFLQEFLPYVKIGIREFVPCRVKLDHTPKLGRGVGQNAFRLSRHSVIGRTKTDGMGRIRVELGPIDFADFLEFIPGSRKLQLLHDLLKAYLNDGLEYDVRFTIRSRTIRRLPLSDRRPKLGISHWLGQPRKEFVEIEYPYERLTETAN
jgi:type VI secretion system protein ImpH